MKKKKVTMQEIADRLGVSKVTVSKALHNKDGAGPELREKIIRLAKETGYQLPSEQKKAREKQEVRKIAVFCDSKFFDETQHGYFYVKIYRKIADRLLKKGGIGTLITLEKETEYEVQRKILEGRTFDGVILLGQMDPAFVEIVREIQIPKIFVDYYDEKKEIDCIVMENFYAMYEGVRYLLECGHREIGFVGTVGATQSITDRYLGYERALMEWRIDPKKEWIVEDRTMDNEVIDLVLPQKLPQAFVCNCDETAFRLVAKLKEQGIQVPEDISIVSFDNDVFAEMCQPQLTTVAVNFDGIAEHSAEQIMKKIRRPDKGEQIIDMLKGKLIFRESVAERGTI